MNLPGTAGRRETPGQDTFPHGLASVTMQEIPKWGGAAMRISIAGRRSTLSLIIAG